MSPARLSTDYVPVSFSDSIKPLTKVLNINETECSKAKSLINR